MTTEPTVSDAVVHAAMRADFAEDADLADYWRDHYRRGYDGKAAELRTMIAAAFAEAGVREQPAVEDDELLTEAENWCRNHGTYGPAAIISQLVDRVREVTVQRDQWLKEVNAVDEALDNDGHVPSVRIIRNLIDQRDAAEKRARELAAEHELDASAVQMALAAKACAEAVAIEDCIKVCESHGFDREHTMLLELQALKGEKTC